MVSHYPLNNVDLDFRRYAHRPFGGREILINRLVEDLLNPRRVPPRTYLQLDHHPGGFGPVKSQDRELGLDMQVMCQLLQMEWSICLRHISSSTFLPSWTRLTGFARMILEYGYAREPITIQQAVIELVRMHYFESDPWVHEVKKTVKLRGYDLRAASDWKPDMISHLALFQKALLFHHRLWLFSGNTQLLGDDRSERSKSLLGSCFEDLDLMQDSDVKQLILSTTVRSHNSNHHQVSRRSQSLPNLEYWDFGRLSPKDGPGAAMGTTCVAFFPHKPLSELDKLSRRRSLSRSHIRAMFTKTVEWAPGSTKKRPRAKAHPCSNCAEYTHATKDCEWDCGYCYSNEHRARNCTVKASNRCKCKPFPQFHRASKCYVQCSRRCGSPHPPGSYKHLNAMLCSDRCCMCGMKGHSGIKCSLKKCPCGEQHLTQDCRWKVECSAKGCYYYLCSLHCKECGMKRQKGSENAFVGRTCQTCLKNGLSTSARAPDPPS